MQEIGSKAKYEVFVSRDELAKILRDLASKVSEGYVEIGTQERTIKQEFDEPVKIEVEYSSSKKVLEIEIKFKKFEKLSI